MRHSLAIFLLLYCASVALSQISGTKKPVEQPQPSATQKKQSTEFDAPGIEKAIRESIQGASTKADPNADEKLGIDRQIKIYTGQLADYTAALSRYTRWLFIATAVLVAVSVWQGTNLKRSVDSYISGERPHIFPTEPNAAGIVNRCNSVLVEGPPLEFPPRPPFVTIAFGNFGKTIGVLRELRMELAFGPLPAKPTFVYSEPIFGYHADAAGMRCFHAGRDQCPLLWI
jgi:hypothetical protein